MTDNFKSSGKKNHTKNKFTMEKKKPNKSKWLKDSSKKN